MVKVVVTNYYSLILSINGAISYFENTTYDIDEMEEPYIKLLTRIPGTIDIAVRKTNVMILSDKGELFSVKLDKNISRAYRIDVNGEKIKSICSSGDTFFAVTTHGSLYALGSNASKKLGVVSGELLRLSKIPNIENVSMVSSGIFHTLFLTENGIVYGCGRDVDGLLGLGRNSVDKITEVYYPRDGNKAIGVFASDTSSFILLSTGEVLAFGQTIYGQLGIRYEMPNIVQSEPTLVDIENVDNIVACDWYTLFLKADGNVYGTGRYPYSGQTVKTDDLNKMKLMINHQSNIPIFIGLSDIYSISSSPNGGMSRETLMIEAPKRINL